MRTVRLGERTGLRVSALALGTGNFGVAKGGIGSDEARRVFEGYVEAGGNLIDLSDAYQYGEAETLVGGFAASCRDDLVIATKYTRTASVTPAPAAVGNGRKAMVQSVEASLKRLNTDRIDLYLAHLDDGITPIEEVARGFEDLVRAGKIVYAGLSNFPAWRVALAVNTADLRGWSPVSAIEVEHSLLQRTTEREVLPMAEGLGLGVLVYSPLAHGRLGGKRRIEETPQEKTVVDTVLAIAQEVGASPANVAVAWCVAKGDIPILGARDRVQLDDGLKAVSLALDAAHLRRLDEASAVSMGYPRDLLDAPQARRTRWRESNRATRKDRRVGRGGRSRRPVSFFLSW